MGKAVLLLTTACLWWVLLLSAARTLAGVVASLKLTMVSAPTALQEACMQAWVGFAQETIVCGVLHCVVLRPSWTRVLAHSLRQATLRREDNL